MLVLTAGIIRAAARIYENSVLRFGSKVTLRTAWAAPGRGSGSVSPASHDSARGRG
jgi:hypothetical protein